MFDFHGYLYLNFISLGSLIVFVFNLLIGIYLLSIKNKSRATFNLGLSMVFSSFMSLAYIGAFGTYYPLGSYHAWVTNFMSMAAILQLTQFFFHFPGTTRPKTARVLLIIQWTVTIGTTAYWMTHPVPGEQIFRTDGQFWDLDRNRLRAIYSIIILLYIFILLIAGIWRTIITTGREKYSVLLLALGFFFIPLFPGIFNFLARRGIVELIVYYYIYDITIIVGWFFAIVLYLNLSKEKTSFMAKIIGVSLVTLLTILLFIGYFHLTDREQFYDEARQREIYQILNDPDYRADSLDYRVEYRPDEDACEVAAERNGVSVDCGAYRREYRNAEIMAKIHRLRKDYGADDVERILQSGDEYFSPYRGIIAEAVKTAKGGKAVPVAEIERKIAAANRVSYRYYIKIKQLPDGDFHKSLRRILRDASPGFRPFRDAIAAHAAADGAPGDRLKDEVLRYVAPLKPYGSRYIRKDEKTVRHYIAYLHYDAGSDRVYEFGFNYLSYRSFIHAGAVTMAYLLIVIIIVVVFGFQLFFLGALVNPLKKLLNGLRKVQQGDLEIEIPVTIEDEIGFITHNFNSMVLTINNAKKKIDDYTNNLEEMVKNRTHELENTRDALWGEMELAKKIQTVLLPQKPLIEGYDIAVFMEPADEVGGDYYDVINVDGLDWIVIGDVSGHGVTAGLIMMMVQTAIHTVLTQNPGIHPSGLLSIINTTISKNILQMGETKYMTLTVMARHRDGEFIFSGLHLDIMIYRKNTRTVELIETDGMWIGIMVDINTLVNDNYFTMQKGDTLMLYTDGLTEAYTGGGADGETSSKMFGSERLKAVFLRLAEKPARDIIAGINSELLPYIRHDDVSIVVIHRQ